MKHILFILFIFCLTSLPCTAQSDAVDFDAIERAVGDRQSPFFYPTLMQRYLNNDTTLSDDEYLHLYIGYAFQEEYNPYRTSVYANVKNELYTKLEHTPAECDSIVWYARHTLDDFPFDLRQMNLLIYALKEKGETQEAAIWEHRLRRIVDTIFSTGDGESPETAWIVIHPTHEYNIINRIGLTGTHYSFVEPYYDHVAVGENPLNFEGFYFNVRKILEEYIRKFNPTE